MIKQVIGLLIIAFGFSACNTTKNMTNEELKLINNGSIDTPFRVLLTTNEKDSLFLRKKCVDVANVENIASNKDVQLFIERLKKTMDVESGVGIAAPQVGLARNIFLFLRINQPDVPVEVAINPRIVSHSEKTICFEGDGCLSIPNVGGNTTRYQWVEVEYYNQKGELKKERLSGTSREEDFTGIIFQHENDHLHGILFTDRLWDRE